VEATDEPMVVPYLDAVRPPQPVKKGIGGGKFVRDPPPRPAFVRATGHDSLEGGVDSNLEVAK